MLDSLVDPLQKTINFRPKPDAVKQEVDRNDDMIRSALRAIASLNRIRYGSLTILHLQKRNKSNIPYLLPQEIMQGTFTEYYLLYTYSRTESEGKDYLTSSLPLILVYTFSYYDTQN